MDARRSALAAADVQTAGGELNLVPLKIAQLAGPQAVPKGDQICNRLRGLGACPKAQVRPLMHSATPLGLFRSKPVFAGASVVARNYVRWCIPRGFSGKGSNGSQLTPSRTCPN
jgi:hypothetical protein